jgi:hypothetical protein
MSAPSFLTEIARSLKPETPLGFFTVQLILVNATLGAANVAGADARFCVTIAIAWHAVLTVIVTGLAVWRPEALKGGRPRGSPSK